MSTDGDADGETTRITREGQVTIPKRFREEFGLEEGDELLWEKTEDGITVRKMTQSAGRGMLVDDVPEAKREAMARYLVDRLPPAADEVSERGEDGLDILEAPTVAVSERGLSRRRLGRTSVTPRRRSRPRSRSNWRPSRGREAYRSRPESRATPRWPTKP